MLLVLEINISLLIVTNISNKVIKSNYKHQTHTQQRTLYIYIYTHTHTHTHIFVYICIYIYIYIYVCWYIYIYIYVYASVFIQHLCVYGAPIYVERDVRGWG